MAALTLLTWNLWFGEFERLRRLLAALDIVRKERPDVVAFQEVVPETLEQMRSIPWLGNDYHLTEGTGVFERGYGTVMMSRLPPEGVHVIPLPSQMGRRLVAIDLFLAGSMIRIGGVHLESLDSTPTRVVQLRRCLDFLAGGDAAVLMGDLNFDAGDREEEWLGKGIDDLWPVLRPGEPGATRDTDANLMALLHSDTPSSRRIDRIFLIDPASEWHPRSIRRLGTTPVLDDPTLYPSDHFGLVATLERAPAT